ncbi:hypothetical protein CEUSTIGMA_g9281.t1 [Chlamydomonas eustigma]|uniref:Uso1/p115-like vesicle tethering protein C-terminal domain-containing protein n=1 Tax=Chlamydomonas eustigma TaxID=1157962 RepID=A0A250XFM1_9CHLO|nr:hypothetical protein CEUSTIGMA_g9281.t1 [Chlamydomonas eustigma]|eukprot:GAX81853.1 hypothetical protein CEUSTIGMA_g9281.t1 [Chlamydomonas eustigma]
MNMLRGAVGRVGGAMFGDARAALTAQHDDESEVEALLQRIGEGLLPEYRREAMGQLKELLVDNPKAQVALGNMGLPVLVSVLMDDRDDIELVRGALESLVLAVGLPAGGEGVPVPSGSTTNNIVSASEHQAGGVNADLFTRVPNHVPMLLALLEEEPVGISDFYVRYHTLQLLAGLLQACPHRLQSAILSSPMGVVRLMDMLSEREVIRNEALALLVELTGSNVEVQKIVAFEGAFDRVFNIVREEGGSDGGSVVQDALHLLTNLLRGNLANQRLFREMGYFSQIIKLLLISPPPARRQSPNSATAGDPHVSSSEGAADALQLPLSTTAAAAAVGAVGAAASFVSNLAASAAAASPTLSRQKAVNLVCLLDAVLLLVLPPSSASEEVRNQESQNRTANQSKLLTSGILPALLSLSLVEGGVASVVIRSQAMECISVLVEGSGPAQEALAAATVVVNVKGGHEMMTALQAALRRVLFAEDARERTAALHLLRGFCKNNPEGQAVLASTLAPMAPSPMKPTTNYTASGVNSYTTAPTNYSSSSYSPHLTPPPASSFGAELAAALSSCGPSNSSSIASSRTSYSVLPSGGSGMTSSPSSTGYVLSASAHDRSRKISSGGVASASDAQVISQRAALVLELLLEGCSAAKQRLLATPLELLPTTSSLLPPELLLSRVMRLVSDGLRQGKEGGGNLRACFFMRLLIVWLTDCPEAVSFMISSSASHLPLLVDAVIGRAVGQHGGGGGDVMVQGLASALLACCFMYGHTAAVPSSGATASSPSPNSLHVYSSSSGAHISDEASSATPSDMVLDVILSRVGLAQFFQRLEDLLRYPALSAASALKRLPKASSRAAVAAVLTGDLGVEGHEEVVDCTTTIYRDDGHHHRYDTNHGGQSAASSHVFDMQLLFDATFAALLHQLEASARTQATQAFSQSSHSSSGVNGEQTTNNADHHDSGTLLIEGVDDSERLKNAMVLMAKQDHELEALRSRNKALAQELMRLPSAAGNRGTNLMDGDPAAHHASSTTGTTPDRSSSQHDETSITSNSRMLTGQSAVDVEARVEAELRASRAEMEAAALRPKVHQLQDKLAAAESQCQSAQAAAALATASATKHEADLRDLSSAYNALEGHAFALEGQLRESQFKIKALQGQVSELQHQAEVTALQRQMSDNGTASSRANNADMCIAKGSHPALSEAEVAKRVEEAVAAARQDAELEGEEAMNDLLVCLGQEEAKVAALSERLVVMGVNVEEILEQVLASGGGADEG